MYWNCKSFFQKWYKVAFYIKLWYNCKQLYNRLAMAEKQPTFIKLDNGKVNFAFHARFIKEPDGLYSWYIPAYKMFFSSGSIDEGQKRAIVMAKSFFVYWKEEKNFNGFLKELHQLGFRATSLHDFTLKQLRLGKTRKAKFKSEDSYIPESFKNSQSVVTEGDLAIAFNL